MTAEIHTGSVFASTWVPNPPPVPDTDLAGYAVAWVDLPDGVRVQAYVEADTMPGVGATGVVRWNEDLRVHVFTPDGVVGG